MLEYMYHVREKEWVVEWSRREGSRKQSLKKIYADEKEQIMENDIWKKAAPHRSCCRGTLAAAGLYGTGNGVPRLCAQRVLNQLRLGSMTVYL